MTPSDVKARVQMIREISADDEAAHSEEDRLREDVLWSIADGKASDPAECARLALTTSEIVFARWCA